MIPDWRQAVDYNAWDNRDVCIQKNNDLTSQDQIKNLKIQPEDVTGMIAFTISDINYAYDMLHDVFQMNNNIVGFKDAFFIVAIDKETAKMGCR